MNNDYIPYSEGGRNFIETFNDFSSQLVISQSTGHLKFEPMPSGELLNQYYNGSFSGGGDGVYNLASQFNPGAGEVAREIVGLMKSFARFGDQFSTHDFGCAYGNLVYAFQEMGIRRATGNEPNRAWVDAGNTYCKGALTHEPLDRALAKLPYEIDLFTSSHVFEHLQDPVWGFEIMKKHLSPEGIIYVRVPNAASMKIFLSGMTDPEIYSFPMHLNYFTPKSMVSLLRQAGLEPFQITTRWLPDMLNPNENIFETLFRRRPNDIVSADAWRAAMCENLLGGELVVLAGHPTNSTAMRVSNIDERVEKAFRFSTLTEDERLKIFTERKIIARRVVPTDRVKRIYAALEVVARIASEVGLRGLAKEIVHNLRAGGFKMLKAHMRVRYARD